MRCIGYRGLPVLPQAVYALDQPVRLDAGYVVILFYYVGLLNSSVQTNVA